MTRHPWSIWSFDDLVVGDEWESPRRTVTETDVVLFAGLSGDLILFMSIILLLRAIPSAGRWLTDCSAWPSPPV